MNYPMGLSQSCLLLSSCVLSARDSGMTAEWQPLPVALAVHGCVCMCVCACADVPMVDRGQPRPGGRVELVTLGPMRIWGCRVSTEEFGG